MALIFPGKTLQTINDGIVQQIISQIDASLSILLSDPTRGTTDIGTGQLCDFVLARIRVALWLLKERCTPFHEDENTICVAVCLFF